MGTWGNRIFENDDAEEFLVFSLRFQNPGIILDALKATIPNIEGRFSPEQKALAAAEVVAAKIGQPSSDFPDDPDAWQDLDKLQLDVSQALINLALKTVLQIKTESNLKSDYLGDQDPNDYNEWLEVVNDLINRLKTALVLTTSLDM